MYTEQNRGFTVITNFGCDCNCKYCITKHHPILQNAVTDKNKIDWGYLEECISNSNAPTVNLSGGGDPFYNWKDNIDFYNHVYDLASKYGKKLDIHTRIIPTDMDLIWKFRKIALSIESNDSRMTRDDCLDYIGKMHDIGVKQITFRQMFGNKKAYQNFLKIKDTIHIPGIMFLADGEYHNYYFTTNNKLYPYFFGFTENDRKEWMKKYEEIEQYCG